MIEDKIRRLRSNEQWRHYFRQVAPGLREIFIEMLVDESLRANEVDDGRVMLAKLIRVCEETDKDTFSGRSVKGPRKLPSERKQHGPVNDTTNPGGGQSA